MIMEGMHHIKLSEAIELISGGTPKTSESSYWGGDIPWLSVKDFGSVPKYVFDAEKHITQEGFNNCASHMLYKDDIIISARGTVGALAMIETNMAFNQSCYGIRGKEGIDNHYLFYLLKTKIAELNANSHGSVFSTITRNTFDSIYCDIPSLRTQRRIAAILSSLDDKIDCNRRINANLEAQAQALFKSWFVDFEPFRGGKFVDSDLGRIPEGWDVKKLTDIANYKNGLAMQKFPPQEGSSSLPVLKIKELGQGYCDESSDRCTNLLPEDVIIEDGDVVFSWSGTLLVDIWCGGRCGLNQHLFKVTPKEYPQTAEEYPKWFYLLWTKHHLRNFQAIAAGKATTMGHIKRSDLEKSLVLVPGPIGMKTINNEIGPLIDEIINIRLQNRSLSSLRDTLLPRLMSGEIRVE